MPQTRVQTLRSSVKNARVGGFPGTLYLNFPDRQLGFVDPSGAPKDLVAIRYFSDSTDYAAGDFVVQSGTVYRARAAVPAGAFSVAQWEALLVGGVFVGDVPPEGPIPGQLWYESDSGNLYVYYQDADSAQWVQVVGTQGAQGEGFVSTALELSLSYIPATTEAVQTQGYSVAGDGGGALYKRSVSEPAHSGKVRSADGSWWEISELKPNAKQFGAKADFSSWASPGTDDTVAIQACIDFAAYYNNSQAYLPAGRYRTTNTLHLGYGAPGYVYAALIGEGPRYAGESYIGGSGIFSSVEDRPAINVQGNFMGAIRNLGVFGRFRDWIVNNNLGSSQAAPLVDDTIAANWIDPALNAHSDSRHAPCAAIVIDGYLGTKKTAKAITGATQANPVVVTSTAHGFTTGEIIDIAAVVGMTQLNGNSYRVEVVNANSFKLRRWDTYALIDGTAFTAYSSGGTATTPFYPDVTYPAFLGAVAQYGKSLSSTILIEDCTFRGFPSGVVISPANLAANGDFTAIRRCIFDGFKQMVSVGQDQSRNVSIMDVNGVRMHTLLTNRRHGMLTGKFGGTVSNLAVGSCNQIVDFLTSGSTGPITFVDFYAEGLWRIGDIDASLSTESGYIFQSCDFGFHGQLLAQRGPAPTALGGSPGGAITIRFVGCAFQNFPSVLVFNHQYVQLDSCSVRPNERLSGTLAAEYIMLLNNALAGGVVFQNLVAPQGQRINFTRGNLDTVSLSGAGHGFVGEKYRFGSRVNCIPHYAPSVYPANDPTGTPVLCERVIAVTGKSSLSSCTLVDRTLTFTYTSRTDAVFNVTGPDNGDVIFDDLTGSVFVVRSRTGTTVTAVLQNNYRVIGGVTSHHAAFVGNSGNFYFINSRIYTPPSFLRGDVASASTIITNCGRDDGFAAWYDIEIAVADYLYTFEQQDRFVSATTGNSKIAARDQAAATITMTGNAHRTQAVKRLSLFVRKPPANA